MSQGFIRQGEGMIKFRFNKQEGTFDLVEDGKVLATGLSFNEAYSERSRIEYEPTKDRPMVTVSPLKKQRAGK